MAITGMKSGPKLGDVIRKTANWIMDNDITDQKLIDDYIRGLV